MSTTPQPAELVATRGRLKGSITRISNWITSDTSGFVMEDFSARLQRLEEVFKEFLEVDSMLSAELSEIEIIEEQYLQTKSALMKAMKCCTETNNKGIESNKSDSLETVVTLLTDQQKLFADTLLNQTPTNYARENQLPRINISKFSGKYIEWNSFKDLYCSTIHNNTSLTNVYKFQYLKGLLTDEAAAIIRHIPVSNENYDVAFGKLTERYEKKKYIMQALIKNFMDLPQVSQPDDHLLRRISDTSDEVVKSLETVDKNASTRDPWLIYLLLEKVDPETKQLWAQKTADEEFPSFESFIKFLNTRAASLEIYNPHKQLCSKTKPVVTNMKSSSSNKCAKCSGSHPLYKCIKFKNLTVAERKNFVRKTGLCYNCLNSNHRQKDCVSTYSCSWCKAKHHSSLHENINTAVATTVNSPIQNESPEVVSMQTVPPSSEVTLQDKSINPSISTHLGLNANIALLPTAIVGVLDSEGNKQKCRLLLDSGSQACFVSEPCVQKLNVQRNNARYSIKGLATTDAGTTKGCIELSLVSNYNSNNQLVIKAYVLNKLTAPLPSEYINSSDWDYINSIQLADPKFNTPQNIDIIIGADYFFSLLCCGQIFGSNNKPIAQNTIFGWVLSGKIIDSPSDTIPVQSNVHIVSIHAEVDLDKSLKRFWEVEEIPTLGRNLTPVEEFCENHFCDNYYIDTNGRFNVKLPFIKSTETLGNSKPAALSRLLSMEKTFKVNKEVGTQYKQFMQEYETLGHMSEVDPKLLSLDYPNVFYLPHHFVQRSSSTTTKLRVVFDGSCRSSTAVSLNSLLGVGYTVQRDLFSILLNFRIHRVTFSADVEKMYRQVLVAPEDQNFQRILWRHDPNSEIKEYQLRTVSYGTSCAPFLSTRVLHQIALNCEKTNPRVSSIIQNNFYIDDLLSGTHELQDAISLSLQLKDILQLNGFHLRKWRSNYPELLQQVSPNVQNDSSLEICDDECPKVLGLHWDSTADVFVFKINFNIKPPYTKRNILSESSKLFDPLGWLAPCTVLIKILYQQLWLEKLGWDETLSEQLSRKWSNFQKEFNCLETITIPRWLKTGDGNIELHCFCDSSELAYATVIYCRQTDKNNKTTVHLLAARTRVAPIKQVSIPRLELNSAVLLSRLFKIVKSVLCNYSITVYAWSDSKVVLAWLASHPRRWNTFVANRTSEILDSLPVENWRHVQSKHNPADVATRGISPTLLPKCSLWWFGPPWLVKNESEWPTNNLDPVDNDKVISEEKSKPVYCILSSANDNIFNVLFEKCSSLSKIVRIVSYCKRFITNCKFRVNHSVSDNPSLHTSGPISLYEQNVALKLLICFVQKYFFADEMKCIVNNKNLSEKSSLKSLLPFIDNEGVLRVGGRLQNSSLSYDSKHPIILPAQHKISNLLIKQFHVTHLHAGCTLLSNIIRQTYWIIGGKRLIRNFIHNCIVCCRYRASTANQLMGNLPEHRVTPNHPFLICGVDYAGPITIRLHKGRGAKTTKGYIALFVCFSTKAMHIECVSDLTSDAFIAALRRFSSRRGAPKHVYCDNATNFIGAKRKLSDLYKFTSSINNDDAISYYLAQTSIEWHMIPPLSPHFGGIWESGVRSVKFHLKRVIGEANLTFEELTTLLTQIEALLNSRPLTPVSENDINSLEILTPSHFLIGDVITSPPECVFEDNRSYCTRWELIQKMRQGFWKKWHHEYLNSLQNRPKWRRNQRNVAVGDLVLLKEENIPPATWPLGRVCEIHPGKDGVVRVVTVRTVKGLFKRSIVKICLLPLYQE